VTDRLSILVGPSRSRFDYRSGAEPPVLAPGGQLDRLLSSSSALPSCAAAGMTTGGGHKRGCLGYPVSNEYAISGGAQRLRRQHRRLSLRHPRHHGDLPK